ncbi:hypothetical protein GM418_14995 [Maribellus comscasis]|uniref:Uncharacterized protein n=1 Tax=Maribellus comscasis TaxID=2681766 RepID=A0A6I6JXJ9_9BACT|nr:hypothetical protein [Maribellus comscasis]QGY44927.1 hypothetical protein GM418_14995 [Maribellus comscasis]
MRNAKQELKQIFQKRGREIRKYTISETGLDTEISSNGQSQSFSIPFEEIEFNETLITKKSGSKEIAFFISVAINLLLIGFLLYQNTSFIDGAAFSGMIIGVVAGLSVWAVQFFKKEKEKIIKGQQNLVFFYNKKEKDEVDWFLKELKSVQRNYIRKKYMKIDDLIPYENQEQTFYWMYSKKFISRSELEILFEELENRKIIRGR